MGTIVDLADAEWELVADLFGPDGRRGAPEHYPRRTMVEAMLWMARTGVQHPDVFGAEISFSGYFQAGAVGVNSGRPFGGDQALLAADSPSVVAPGLPAGERGALYFVLIAEPSQSSYGAPGHGVCPDHHPGRLPAHAGRCGPAARLEPGPRGVPDRRPADRAMGGRAGRVRLGWTVPGFSRHLAA
jgi:hypothetical protein